MNAIIISIENLPDMVIGVVWGKFAKVILNSRVVAVIVRPAHQNESEFRHDLSVIFPWAQIN